MIENLDNFANIPKPIKKDTSIEEEKEFDRAEYIKECILLVTELIEKHEVLPFSEINPEAYSKIKTEQEIYPGYSTPIDDLLIKFKEQGIKVVFTDDPNSGNICILPSGSNDIINDSLFPRHLNQTENMNALLKKLIELDTNCYHAYKKT